MNMSKKIVFVFITFLCFTLSVNAGCADIEFDSIVATDEEKEKCLSSNENGFACEIGYRSTGISSRDVCVKSEECADGFLKTPDQRCYEAQTESNDDSSNDSSNDSSGTESGTNKEIDKVLNGGTNNVDNATKCTTYTTEKSCLTMNHCQWINGTCTNSYIAEDPCSEKEILTVIRFFGYLLLIVKVAIPLIIIIMGTFDLFKSVVDKDEKSLSKQVKVLLWRIVGGVFIFFLPTVIYAVFNLSAKLEIINDNKYDACMQCLFKPTECNIPDTTNNVADTDEDCPTGQTKGVDGICYSNSSCGSHTTRDTCPSNCKWSARNGCQSK